MSLCTTALTILTLGCTTPPMRRLGAGVVAPTVSASLNAQDFTPARSSLFRFYAAPRVSAVLPTMGPRAGQTLLTVHGVGLYGEGEHLLCRFEHEQDARAGTSHEASSALVGLSQHPRPRIETGPLRGVGPLYERLPTLMPASWDARGGVVRCYSPPNPAVNMSLLEAPSLTLRVEVTANGQQFTSDAQRFVQRVGPVISLIVPSGGPKAGGTALQISGFGIADGAEYLCRFGALRLVSRARIQPRTGVLHCTSPPLAECDALGAIPSEHDQFASAVSISINGQQYCASHPYDFSEPMRVSAISPSSGPRHGNLVVSVHGANLRRGHRLSRRANPHPHPHPHPHPRPHPHPHPHPRQARPRALGHFAAVARVPLRRDGRRAGHVGQPDLHDCVLGARAHARHVRARGERQRHRLDV